MLLSKPTVVSLLSRTSGQQFVSLQYNSSVTCTCQIHCRKAVEQLKSHYPHSWSFNMKSLCVLQANRPFPCKLNCNSRKRRCQKILLLQQSWNNLGDEWEAEVTGHILIWDAESQWCTWSWYGVECSLNKTNFTFSVAHGAPDLLFCCTESLSWSKLLCI